MWIYSKVFRQTGLHAAPAPARRVKVNENMSMATITLLKRNRLFLYFNRKYENRYVLRGKFHSEIETTADSEINVNFSNG